MISAPSTTSSRLFDNNNSSQRNHFLSIPWLQKKQSSWSLRSFTKNRQGSISTASIALSVASTTFSTESSIAESTITIPEEEEEALPPPHYEDPSHPWVFNFPKSYANRVILPREEEGREVLPQYSCEIDKTLYIHVKCEFSQPNVKSKNRSWKDLYVTVYGTKIMAYHRNPKGKKKVDPIWSYSMQGAEVTVPTDYLKYHHVIRLRIDNGPQFLFNTQTEFERNDWLGVIESAIHVSSDLDVRTMPQFVTLVSRRRRRRPRPTAEYRETLV
ncbi:uncharacterized protein B0P05DRAFT_552489 [Gilbertella persicaria]|uniref:uncharacterized protein n=1 Tax=Gilbertella persicaria TaxID=101096 RepID=UPI00221F1F46|nr:uncharacterized protein B0P05DRAFT_552489 [Gilbertella persicaria]KAI8067670.1 hypothetical protein B0P05DRAFT_552489 [Gilbertella persicaria]